MYINTFLCILLDLKKLVDLDNHKLDNYIILLIHGIMLFQLQN